MNRFSWTALGMALMMLAACNASAPTKRPKAAPPLRAKSTASTRKRRWKPRLPPKLRRQRVSRSHRQAPVRLLTSMRCKGC